MTATTVEAPLMDEATLSAFNRQLVRELADAMIADFNCIIRTLTNTPGIAPLLLPAFRSVNVALNSVHDPDGTVEGTGPAHAKQHLVEAFGGTGAHVVPADYPGFEGMAATLPGGAVSLWFFTQTAPGPVEAPAVAPVDPAPDDAQAESASELVAEVSAA